MFLMFFLYISASCGTLVDFRKNQKNNIFLYCHNAKLTNVGLVCYDFLYSLQNMLGNLYFLVFHLLQIPPKNNPLLILSFVSTSIIVGSYILNFKVKNNVSFFCYFNYIVKLHIKQN